MQVPCEPRGLTVSHARVPLAPQTTNRAYAKTVNKTESRDFESGTCVYIRVEKPHRRVICAARGGGPCQQSDRIAFAPLAAAARSVDVCHSESIKKWPPDHFCPTLAPKLPPLHDIVSRRPPPHTLAAVPPHTTVIVFCLKSLPVLL